jgi:hypothetical protein
LTYSRHKNDRHASGNRYGQFNPRAQEPGFRCLGCRLGVCSDPAISGVQSRNHCPYCLWSRHMDLHVAGDRLAGCRAGMRPIGLTVKRGREKYGLARAGELMLVHLCGGCDKLSINRIAGDDHPRSLLEAFAASDALEAALLARLEASEIVLLGQDDLELVRARIYGQGALALG